MNDCLVTAEWLLKNINLPNLKIFDTSFHTDFTTLKNFIPHSQIFDYERIICDSSSHLPHMMPSENVFQNEVRKLGVNQNDLIVFYDRSGVYSSPRGRWMCKAMGLTQVYVLDGGLPNWIEKKYPLQEDSISKNTLGNFTAVFKPDLICDSNFILSHLSNTKYKVIDARSTGRFNGLEPEPRPGLRAGHIPNSINVPFKVVQDGNFMKSIVDLKKIFAPFHLENKKLIFSCGSGVTACIVALAAETTGLQQISIYDGSWSDWGSNQSLPLN
jgi:thiosulfate/3-mercaptopyruvate sulfurtransferase